jgi:hypothetical protein
MASVMWISIDLQRPFFDEKKAKVKILAIMMDYTQRGLNLKRTGKL